MNTKTDSLGEWLYDLIDVIRLNIGLVRVKGRFQSMKIHNNNLLKNLGPSADQTQKSYQADQAAKQLRTEPLAAEKFRKIRELQDQNAKRNASTGLQPVQDGKDSPSKGFRFEKGSGESTTEEEKPGNEKDLPPSGRGRIDIKI